MARPGVRGAAGRARGLINAGALSICLATAIGSTVLADDSAAANSPSVNGTPSPEVEVEVDSVEVDPVEFDPVAASDLDVLNGQDAVEELQADDTLDEVADSVGLESDELVDELLADPSLILTDTGMLGYIDTLGHDDADHLESANLVDTAAPLPAGLQVGALDSRPGSGRVLYLDFDGHTTIDVDWRRNGSPATIESLPFSLDADPGFSPAEQAIIFEVWQRVTEDFAPFDVNVTTVDPGSLAGGGQRIVISPTNWVGNPNVLGVALVGTFATGVDKPAFVFSSTRFGPIAKSIAESVSHEAGHTFGLYHHGHGSLDYYVGHNGWAPIMGQPVSLQPLVTQWSKGEYSGASRPNQNDLAVIAGLAGYAPDDAGGSVCAPVVVGRTSVTPGAIGSTGDRDVFAVDVGAGQLSVSLRPPPGTQTWSNLLATITIRNNGGALIATSPPTPPSSWVASAVADVPVGRYTIEVDPIGWRTPIDGFSVYGSLGAYELTVNGADGAQPPPPSSCASTFTAVSPDRLIDTRSGIGGFRRVAAERQVTVQVVNGTTVPSGATAAVLSIAAVNPSAAGFVTAYPCSEARQDTSTVNFVVGQTVANTTIAALSPAGQVCVWASAETDILIDITGWLGPAGTSRFTPLGPTRVVDTRSSVGGVRLSPGSTLSVDLDGSVPAGTTAVALNATAVGASEPAFLTVFPCGALPDTSTINYVAGEARPNNTIVGLTGGRFCVYSFAAVDVLIDVTGSFGPTGLSYQPTAPVRVIDTRQARPPLVAGEAATYSVAAPSLGGSQPSAAYVNVTAVDHAVPGYVTTYDCVTRRDTSTVNQQVGQAAANGAIVPLNGIQSCAWMFGGGHLIVDLNGWWVP